MDAFALTQLFEAQQRSEKRYLEFLRTAALSTGLYVLAAGDIDPQQPHTEDEVYYVISGRATIQVADEHRPVEAGTVIFVAAGVEHRFHSILEELKVLVFFAPAEYSAAIAVKEPD